VPVSCTCSPRIPPPRTSNGRSQRTGRRYRERVKARARFPPEVAALVRPQCRNWCARSFAKLRNAAFVATARRTAHGSRGDPGGICWISFIAFLIRCPPHQNQMLSGLFLSFSLSPSIYLSADTNLTSSFSCALSLSLSRAFVTVAREREQNERTTSRSCIRRRGRRRIISCPTRTLFPSAVRDEDRDCVDPPSPSPSLAARTDEFGDTSN